MVTPTPLPITVVTGFLGSGKTTLLNRLLRHPDTEPCAVVVNEVGEVGIDNVLFETVAEDMVLLDNGCLCCGIRSDLVSTLVELGKRLSAPGPTRIYRVILETTGLADPAPILHTLMAQPELTRRYYLDGVVTTADGVVGEAELSDFPEAAKQVALADRLVVTKTDVANPAAVGRLVDRLVALNPGAEVLRSTLSGGEVETPSSVFDVGVYDARRREANVTRWLPDERFPSIGVSRGDGGHRHRAIDAFCVYLEQPPSRAVLGLWLNRLTTEAGAMLLRIKGVVRVGDSDTALLVNGVQHQLYPLARLPKWPFPDRRSRIIFIVNGLSRERVMDVLAQSEAVCR